MSSLWNLLIEYMDGSRYLFFPWIFGYLDMIVQDSICGG